MKDYKRLTEICNDIIGDCKPCKPQENALKEIIKAIESGELCDGEEFEKVKKDRDEYKHRAEAADIVISELRAKLSKAEHDRDRYARRITLLQAENTELRERLDKAVDKTIVSEMLAKYFDCPCNFSPLDEEMWAYCRDNCVDDNIECWIRVINKKCAELKGEKK